MSFDFEFPLPPMFLNSSKISKIEALLASSESTESETSNHSDLTLPPTSEFGATNLSAFLEDIKRDISVGNKDQINRVCFYVTLVLYIVVISIGSCGNVLVVIAVFWRKNMRTVHNSFIGTLAFSDFFLCIVSLPVNLWEMLFQQWPFGPETATLCSLVLTAQQMPIFLSSLAIMAIGWDRYRCVITPERYLIMKSFNFHIFLLFIFIM